MPCSRLSRVQIAQADGRGRQTLKRPAADAAKIKAPINARYGELDTRITDGWKAFGEALTAAGVPQEGHIYKAANHDFRIDTTHRYDEATARETWEHTLNWFNKYLRAEPKPSL